MIKKRGISTIVATVLIILITIAAVAIIWAGVIPMIKDKVAFNEISGVVSIVTSKGYTTYDSEKKIASVQVKRGAGETKMKSIKIIFSSQGNSYSGIVEAPEPNQEKTYAFNLSGYPAPESVSVAPIFTVGKSKKEGDISSVVDIKKGILVKTPGELYKPGTDNNNETISSCSDGVQNQNEIGIDCGGMCTSGVETICDDGIDNDRDCLTDSADSDCASGPIIWYKFDRGSGNVASDSSGNGNNGTIDGAVWIDGKHNKSLSFDGVNDYISIEDNKMLHLNDSLTIEAWVYQSSAPGADDYDVPLAKFYEYNRPNYRLVIGDWRLPGSTQPQFVFYKDGWKGVISPENLSLNEWHHVAATFDRGVGKIYVDGVLKAERDDLPKSLYPVYTSDPLYIGRMSYRNPGWFSGKLDDLKLYNRSLSEQEIVLAAQQ